VRLEFKVMSRLFILIFFSLPLLADAQGSVQFIRGKVVFESNELLPGATVYIENTTQGVQTDVNGHYPLKHPGKGKVTLVASYVGYQTLSKIIHMDAKDTSQYITVNYRLKENSQNILEVVVKGESRAARIERSGFAVTSVDTRHLQKKSVEINEVLDRTPGLRVRRDGGMGSRTEYNINGLSGRSVRVFIDGVPAESFGSSYSVSSLQWHRF
jgi:hypothetical protein